MNNNKMRNSVRKGSKSLQRDGFNILNSVLKPITNIASVRSIEHSSPEPLNSLQLMSPSLNSPVFSLRSENFKLKDSIVSLNMKINNEISDKKQKVYMMTPSHSRTVLEEELEAKKHILDKFEKEWESVCQKYENSYNNQVKSGLSQQLTNFENVICSLEERFNSNSNTSEMESLSNEISNLEKNIQECKAMKENNLKRINGLNQSSIKKSTSRVDIKKKADNLNSGHINQMKQLKWEEQRLKQGLEATLKTEQEIQSQVDKKNAHLEKLKGQIAELNSKKI